MRPSSPWGHRPVERLRVLGLQANPARGGKRGRLEPGEAPGRPLELSSESELPGRSQCRRPLQGQPKASVKVKFKGSTRGSLAGPGTRPCDSPGRRGHPAPAQSKRPQNLPWEVMPVLGLAPGDACSPSPTAATPQRGCRDWS